MVKNYSQTKINDAIYQKAIGYLSEEVVEESAPDDDGVFKIVKRKVTKKYIPGDLTAVKIILEKLTAINDDRFQKMTEEELFKEKIRAIEFLIQLKKNKKVKTQKNEIDIANE